VARTIEEYLEELRGQLAGADPALVQDALYDAEEYLRNEMATASVPGADGVVQDPSAALARAIEQYGTPEEVAAAYRDAEVTLTRALRPTTPRQERSWLSRFFGVVVDPAAYGALFYMLLALATGTIYFTVVVTGLSMSLGLAVLIIGIPFFLLFVAVVRAISLAEGRLVEALLGERMPRRPRLAPASTGEGMVARLKAWFTDYRTWTTMLYMALQLVLGILYFTIVVTGLATAFSLIALPFVQVFTDAAIFWWGGYAHELQPWALPFSIFFGVLVAIVTLHVCKFIGQLHAAYAKVMLVGRFSDTA
jgi:hypothetical protein